MILGYIGIFFARIIKAGVSRQREYLADASAVQFTRQTDGIANALKKIGGYSHGSRIEATDPEEVSHMLFGEGSKFAGLFATHPPLVARIQALDPAFRESDFPRIDRRQSQREAATHSEVTSGFTPGAASVSGAVPDLAASIATSVGQPALEHVQYAQRLRQSIPESLYHAAHSSDFAYLLTIALVLDRSGSIVDRQVAIAREQLGSERARLLRRYYDELATIGAEYRLPLLEIAFPALKQRPTEELDYLVAMTTRMIETDGEVDLYEFCFHRVLTTILNQGEPAASQRSRRRPGRQAIQTAAIELLRALADYGHDDEATSRAAFSSGTGTLGQWAKDVPFAADSRYTISVLDHSFDTLIALNSKGKESLLRAISATAGYDGKLSVPEAELIRAVCATLQFPLPPIVLQ